MNTTTQWLDGMHSHASELESIARELYDLAYAFSCVGNETVSARLSELAKVTKRQAGRVRDLTSGKVNGDYQEAVASSANVLRAMLVGTQLDKTPKGS